MDEWTRWCSIKIDELKTAIEQVADRHDYLQYIFQRLYRNFDNASNIMLSETRTAKMVLSDFHIGSLQDLTDALTLFARDINRLRNAQKFFIYASAFRHSEMQEMHTLLLEQNLHRLNASVEFPSIITGGRNACAAREMAVQDKDREFAIATVQKYPLISYK